MPKSNAVWGIDIGNSALKALRCRPGDQPDEIIADAFDFIEYPKILSEPGAEPSELVAEAVKQFLKRNTVKGDQVVMSVPGQTGLARFIKLPPVETKKIPAIVAYEARQQIPFALEDVAWAYQQMPGGTVEEGFALEAEVGLFAMKREQVYRALEPLTKVGVEVQVVQLAPLALYNFLVFDQMQDLPPEDEFIPDAPPPSVVVLSMGTDATDLVITNGFRVWQRSVPLGGNHFTRALSKDLKLTFAKAEHLKRNATAAEDPKAVFQAMRPVFNDLLTEIQRSIGYFTTIDRAANIDYIVGLGNAMKLPGLRKYLSQSLGHEVKQLAAFRGLKGDEVVEAPAFKENRLSFATAYGLAVQGVGKAPLRTNLLPAEIVKERVIKAKKPWAVAAVAVLLIALAISFSSYTRALGTVDEARFGSSESALTQAVDKANRLKKEADDAKGELESINKIGENLTSNVEGRVLWLELLRAVNACLPTDPPDNQPKEIWQRNVLYVVSVEARKVPDMALWFNRVKEQRWYLPPGAEAAAGAAQTEAEVPGPSGPGYVVQISGYHFHNRPTPVPGFADGAQFLRETLIASLNNMTVILPYRDEQGKEHKEPVSLAEMGIGYPALIDPRKPQPMQLQNPNLEGAPAARAVAGRAVGGGMGVGMGGMGGGMGDDTGTEVEPDVGLPAAGAARRAAPAEPPVNPKIDVARFDFRVQFCWQQKPPSERHAERKSETAPAGEAAPTGEAASTGEAGPAAEAAATAPAGEGAGQQ